MEELKPCPFCGSYAIASYNSYYEHQVYCSNEKCFMSRIIQTDGFTTEKEAAEAWNRRANENV